MSLQQVTTPASSLVQKSKYDISVQCSKAGYQSATVVNKSGVEPWVFGNLLFGGIIGLIIDVTGGAQNHYDTTMSINLPASSIVAPITSDPGLIKAPTA